MEPMRPCKHPGLLNVYWATGVFGYVAVKREPRDPTEPPAPVAVLPASGEGRQRAKLRALLARARDHLLREAAGLLPEI